MLCFLLLVLPACFGSLGGRVFVLICGFVELRFCLDVFVVVDSVAWVFSAGFGFSFVVCCFCVIGAAGFSC